MVCFYTYIFQICHFSVRKHHNQCWFLTGKYHVLPILQTNVHNMHLLHLDALTGAEVLLVPGPDPGFAKRGGRVSKLRENWLIWPQNRLNLHDLVVKRWAGAKSAHTWIHPCSSGISNGVIHLAGTPFGEVT